MQKEDHPSRAGYQRRQDTRTILGVAVFLGTTSGLVAAVLMNNANNGYEGLAGLFGLAVAMAYGSLFVFLRRD